ncbi:MAG: hypothetical protein ACYDH8_12775 [Syntrophales bacterium]
MWEKLVGLGAVVVGVTALVLLDFFVLPVFVKIIGAFVGVFICLVGFVFFFAEGQIFTKDRLAKTAPKVG